MALAGISTLGITFGYGVETTAGEKPSAFTQLTRINAIGGITIENEQIDASALEDAVSKRCACRRNFSFLISMFCTFYDFINIACATVGTSIN